MRVWVCYNSTHAHLWRTVDQTVGDETIRIGDVAQCAGDGQDAVVGAGHDLANASADTRLVPEVGDVLAGLADDDAGFLGGDNGTDGELGLGVLFVGAGLVVGVEPAKLVGEIVHAGVHGGRDGIFGRHFGGSGSGEKREELVGAGCERRRGMLGHGRREGPKIELKRGGESKVCRSRAAASMLSRRFNNEVQPHRQRELGGIEGRAYTGGGEEDAARRSGEVRVAELRETAAIAALRAYSRSGLDEVWRGEGEVR